MLPAHLKRYVVEQDYSRYTPVDQEVWRYIMRQLIDFLSEHAPACYRDGLAKTGIEVDRIPEISAMSAKLERFGWRAVPVSGFIPPAAFMELQALSYLPIASDMRSLDHLLYTPAPDIVHEAAGHAPILVEPEYAGYLRAYAQVAKKAIISKHDMDQYEAIRHLSDLKEDQDSTPEMIAEAEARLTRVNSEIGHLSEAALLSRMNWWTAEYGLVGTLEEPRLFGAGLLSSVGEATACLLPKVKKIPLTLDCINYSYDITEPQPQLFVTPSFGHLVTVLEELAETMAFRTGGMAGLEKARLAETPNTVELNSGIQISGRLKAYSQFEGSPSYLQFDGRTQLSLECVELAGHSAAYHAAGFGSPVGFLKGATKCMSEMNEAELSELGITVNGQTRLEFASGVVVEGVVVGWLRSPTGRLLVVSFHNCTVTRGSEKLFDPSWGTFDMSVGSSVVSVFGGPADRLAYGETDDFVARVVPRKVWPAKVQARHRLYQEIRDVREGLESGSVSPAVATTRLAPVVAALRADFPRDWLAFLNLSELGARLKTTPWLDDVATSLKEIRAADAGVRKLVDDGIRVMN
jgi:phenylalanine-4-hydroxylase